MTLNLLILCVSCLVVVLCRSAKNVLFVLSLTLGYFAEWCIKGIRHPKGMFCILCTTNFFVLCGVLIDKDYYFMIRTVPCVLKLSADYLRYR